MTPRKRKPKNEWMAAYAGLHVRHDGVFELLNPNTGKKIGLQTKDEKLAIKYWQRYMPKWMSEAKTNSAEAIISKLEGMDEVDNAGSDTTLADYAKYWRTEWLCYSVDERRRSVFGDCRVKAKGKNGAILGKLTQKDYGNFIIRDIENSAELQFPLNDKYADVKIRKFLSPWLNKNTTYNHLRNVLSILFAHAFREGLVRRNPINDIPPLERTKRLVYLPDEAYAAITTALMTHNHFGIEQNGEWRSRICDLQLFVGSRPADTCKIEDAWFDESGKFVYTASKNKTEIEVTDESGALAETVLWLRNFKREQGKISKYLCVYPKYMGIEVYRQAHVSATAISRAWSQAVVDAGYDKSAFHFKDIRKKSLADDAGQNKGGHSKAMQEYYESVKSSRLQVTNTLVNPRLK